MCAASKAWIQIIPTIKSTASKRSSFLQTSRVSCKEKTLAGGYRIDTTRETSVLEQNVSGSENWQSVAPYYRFIDTESISPGPKISYGNSRINSFSHTAKRLGNFRQLIRRVSAHPNTQGSQKIPRLCIQYKSRLSS